MPFVLCRKLLTCAECMLDICNKSAYYYSANSVLLNVLQLTVIQYIENLTVLKNSSLGLPTITSINLYIAESVFFPEKVAKILA